MTTKKLFDNRKTVRPAPRDRCREGCPTPWPLTRPVACLHCRHHRFPGAALDGLHFDAEAGPWDNPLDEAV